MREPQKSRSEDRDAFLGRSVKVTWHPLRRAVCLFLAMGLAFGAWEKVVGAGSATLYGNKVGLTGSIRRVGQGIPSPGREVLVRGNLEDAEMEAQLDFEVVLKMRRFDELQARLQNRETIFRSEMEEKYWPQAADYQAVVDWLSTSGFEIVQSDPTRLAVFARGSIRKMAEVFQVNFARVANDLGEFTSATNEPQAPSDIAAMLVGINGLQPHIQPRRHLVFGANSLTSYATPYLPRQVLHAYNGDLLPTTGAGQEIGIVIDTFPLNADLSAFWSLCGVNQSLSNITKIQVVSGNLAAPSGEETLDVEWSSAIAAGAKIRIYATKDLSSVHLDQAYARILSDLPAETGLRQISLSYGIGETYTTLSLVKTDAQYFASLASGGVTVFVAAGDGGSSPGTTGHDHTGPTQAESPASDVSVTGVGGTSLTMDSSSGNVTSETAWYDGGGGVSVYFSRPTWQSGAGLPAGSARAVPDVAAVADGNTGGYLILNGTTYVVGGTSWAAPTWAGFCALINQNRANYGLSSLGLLGPKIYPLLGANPFRDIVTGTNGPSGVYSAGIGYDLCTGLGVPNLTALMDTLTPRAPSLSLQSQSQSTNAGGTATFSVTATGSAPISYQWQISSDGGSSWTNLTDSSIYGGSLTNVLTISAAPVSLNGAQFRCTVTNAVGSIMSSAVTLTVSTPGDVPTMPGWALIALAFSLMILARLALEPRVKGKI